MGMVRVTFKDWDCREEYVEGWDFRMNDGGELWIDADRVIDGEHVVEPLCLGLIDDMEYWSVETFEGSISQLLARCESWQIGEDEVELLYD